ncbi:hypothetical protein PIB30_016479 [Stylosanthes scabra]|uniref:Uncharacterized protein n=1 Tax=Stylosanthes scabra TaxID=79078 RepID=A0ABU6Y949_9FABA|nr:hypothetical protein [Stylosanthes scabra]
MAHDHVRTLWWEKFRKKFRFRKGQEQAMYIAWCTRAAKRLRDLFHAIHIKDAPTHWIPPYVLQQLKEYWATEDYIAVCRKAKASQASSTDGSLHR